MIPTRNEEDQKKWEGEGNAAWPPEYSKEFKYKSIALNKKQSNSRVWRRSKEGVRRKIGIAPFSRSMVTKTFEELLLENRLVLNRN